MQRPIIFLATSDPALERAALDAAIETRHGIRHASTLRQAATLLEAGADDVALAIIDTTGFDMSLLHILEECAPDFPIVAIVGGRITAFSDPTMPAKTIGKPVKESRLAKVIQRTALDADITPEGTAPIPPRGCEPAGVFADVILPA